MSVWQPIRSQLVFGAFLFVVVLTVACSNATERTGSIVADRAVVGTSGTPAVNSDRQTIELSGCLQKSNGSYVVTETSRRAANGSLRTYRLQGAGKNTKLEPLVGKHVRVSGVLMDQVDPMQDDERRANDLIVGTSGTHDGAHAAARPQVVNDEPSSAEPSRIDVSSILPVAERCGTK